MSQLRNEKDVKRTASIDGREVRPRPDQTILDAARSIGIEIPALCRQEGTTNFGGCRLCVVEVEGKEELLPACSTRVEAGMVIHTASHGVIEARRFILGLLLEDHLNDCDDCRIRETCALRHLAADLDIEIVKKHEAVSREVEGRIARVPGRCILCGRCVRVCAEVQGACAISFRGRGAKTTVGPPKDLSLKDAGCVLCRKCVDVCPAGAIEFLGKIEEKE